MLKLTRKIKAFTISEVLIVLMLTSIVVGLAFSVLILVQKQMGNIQENFKKQTESNKLETALWLDFNRYSEISYNPVDNEIKMASPTDSIHYKFHEHFVIKAQDTFKVSIASKHVLLSGKQVNADAIDALKIIMDSAFLNQELFVYKNNDAALFMK